MEWLDMISAPLDGTLVLLLLEDGCLAGRWRDGAWM
jgi:hypothetical protein